MMLALLLMLAGLPAQAQSPDTLRLGVLYDAVERRDARSAQLDIHQDITNLSLGGLGAARRPQLELSARAIYQSETASIPFDAAPFKVPTPPKDQYEVAAEIGQLLYDGGRIALEEEVQRRRLAERTAEVHASLYPLRTELNAAFFAALLHQEQLAQLDLLAADLEARRTLVAVQARDGVALPADVAAVEAELVYVRQRLSAAEAARRAAMRRIELLTGRSLFEGDVLAIPAVADAVARVLASLDALDISEAGRPEFERFARATDRARAEAALLGASTKPRVSAFARLAFGRPGYDFFDDTIRPYGTVGLRAQWSPFDWGATTQRVSAAERQADLIAADAAAFEARLRREVLDAAYAVERLEAVLASDEHAIALRERVERAARRQLEEGVLVAAEYIQKRNDVFEARLQHRTHRVELAEARTRLLTMLGIAIPAGADALQEPISPLRPFTLVDPTETER